LEHGVVDLHIGTIGINSTALQVACPPPGIEAKKVEEISADHHSRTYIVSAVALESAGVDLDIGTITGINSSILKLDVPRQDIENFQERPADHHSSTYLMRCVGVEGRIMDDKSSIINSDCPSELKVECGPPEIGAEISRKFWGQIRNYLHRWQCCSSNVLSWISTSAPFAIMAPP
jgi:hypothetical protein